MKKRTLLIVALMIAATTANALRIGNNLVGVGDSVDRLQDAPGITERDNRNRTTDQSTYTYTENGMTHTIEATDGKIRSITDERRG